MKRSRVLNQTAVAPTTTAVPLPTTAVAPTTAVPAPLRTAVAADRTFVASLQRRFSNQLGFLPTAAIDALIEERRVTLGIENGEPAGYLIARRRLRCQTFTAPIVQAAVCMDLRRRKLGMAMVEALCQDAWVDGRSVVQCWCREDLEACDFWNACGFVAVADRHPGNARNKRMILYRRPLPGCSDVTLRTVPANAGYRAKRIEPQRPSQWLLDFGDALTAGLPDVVFPPRRG